MQTKTLNSWSRLPTTSFCHFCFIQITSDVWMDSLPTGAHTQQYWVHFMMSNQTNPKVFSYASLKFDSNLISESQTLHIDILGHCQAYLFSFWTGTQCRLLKGSMHIPNNLISSLKIMDLFISVFFLMSYYFPIYTSTVIFF